MHKKVPRVWATTMKKILFILLAVIGFGFTTFAGQWKVSVATTTYYEYVSTDGKYQFTETQGTEHSTIQVTANSESDAKAKANEKCKEICTGKVYIKTETKDGVQYKVYKYLYTETIEAWELK